MKSNTFIFVILAVFTITLTASCGKQSKYPLEEFESVYLEGINKKEDLSTMKEWQQRASKLKDAIEGRAIDIERPTSGDAFYYDIDQPFVVSYVQENPRNCWTPTVILKGSVKTDEPFSILNKQFASHIRLSLDGIDENGERQFVGNVRYPENELFNYDEDTHEIHLEIIIRGEHISHSKVDKFRFIAHCTRFVMITY